MSIAKRAYMCYVAEDSCSPRHLECMTPKFHTAEAQLLPAPWTLQGGGDPGFQCAWSLLWSPERCHATTKARGIGGDPVLTFGGGGCRKDVETLLLNWIGVNNVSMPSTKNFFVSNIALLIIRVMLSCFGQKCELEAFQQAQRVRVDRHE